MKKIFFGGKIWVYLLAVAAILLVVFKQPAVSKTAFQKCNGFPGEEAKKCRILTLSKLTIPEGLALMDKALKANVISLDECHYLTHEIGHRAYLYYSRDFGKIINGGTPLCQYAYQHGVEAEITLRSDHQTAELNQFCELVKGSVPDYTCFHGAGHGWLGATGDIDYSLAQCEKLTGNAEDMRQCYLGVFSEFTNIGRNLNSKYRIDPEDPLKTCRKLPLKFQEACDIQFSILFTEEDYHDIDRYLSKCLPYEPQVQSRCVKAIASGYTSSVFLKSGKLIVPQIVFSFSPRLRQDFIYSAMRVMIDGFTRSGSSKDTEAFCDNFSTADKAYCESVIDL